LSSTVINPFVSENNRPSISKSLEVEAGMFCNQDITPFGSKFIITFRRKFDNHMGRKLTVKGSEFRLFSTS